MPTPSGRIADPLTPEMLNALREQLAPGERLAWAASPVPMAFEDEANGVGKLEAVSIIGGGYAAIGSLVAAIWTGHWFWFAVPIALLVIGVLAYVATRSVRSRAQRAITGTVYGLSTRNVMIIKTYPAREVQVIPIDTIADVAVVNERDGFADLSVRTTTGEEALLFRGLTDGEQNRMKLVRVIRDPKMAEEQMAAAEAYSRQMHQLARQSMTR